MIPPGDLIARTNHVRTLFKTVGGLGETADDRLSDERRQPFQGRTTSPRSVKLWHAVLTRSRHERKVYDQLLAKGIEAFFPTTHKWSHYRNRRKRIEWPLFPGYCFLRISTGAVLPVLSCSGVSHIVSFAGRPAPIPDYEIDAIQRLVATTLQYDAWPFVKEGTSVRVTRGPLAGTRGHLVKKGANFRLLLAVEMLGRVLSVQVDAADVERL